MSTDAKQQQTQHEPLWWLRDIHRFEHTITVDRGAQPGNQDSWGMFLDGKFVTEAGEFIGDKPEVKALSNVWYAANKFHGIESSIEAQAEQTCNVIAALNDVARHDVILDDEMWGIVRNMQVCGIEVNSLRSTIRELSGAKEHLTRASERVRGVFRLSHRGKIEDRLERFIKEQAAMIEAFEGYLGDFDLPQTAYQARQYVLSQLVLQLERALEILTPLRRKIKDAPLPEDLRQRIITNEATFLRARSQVKKWRDNPSQRFGGKVKELVLLLLSAAADMATMKDESYHAISKLGAVFYCRTGVCKNPYT